MKEMEKVVASVEAAISAIKNGKMVIMVDDEDRENEGDLVFAADCVNSEHINFMAKEARGLICLTLEPKLVNKLKLPMMEDTTKKDPTQSTAFTVSIEARRGVTTGISAADRAHTVKVAIDKDTMPEDIVVPGHIFPLKAREGGVLERAGHTEGSVDIAKLAGFSGAGVICEIMNDDGTMARMSDLEVFAKKHDLVIVAIADLIQYRLMRESMVKVVSEGDIKTDFGTFKAKVFRSLVDSSEHLALIKGDDFENQLVDVRVQNQRSLIDTFSSKSTQLGGKFNFGLKMLSEVDRGVFLYLGENKNDSFSSQLDRLVTDKSQKNMTPIAMDRRLHGTGAQILRSLGVKSMKVHSFTPINFKGLSGFNLTVEENVVVEGDKK
jgi:3,4-dihydroxy 2-butanone 4-phosphate synthase/GTP cyclohydrolase II